jgi:hypothetical protein
MMSKSPLLLRHRNENGKQAAVEPWRKIPMKCLLMDYVQEKGFNQLTRVEQQHWLGAYHAYMEAMANAGVLKSSVGLHSPAGAATVRTADGKHVVLDGPYADSKEQLGGFHIIEVPDLDAAISWASRSPTSLHGVVEVRPIQDKTIADWIAEVSEPSR